MFSASHIFWSLGFRPFYALAALWAVIMLPVSVLGITGEFPAFQSFDPITWHMHEMVFGYTAAVICGFLLTAVPNWTGLETPKGIALQGLALLWVLGRVGMLVESQYYFWVLDILFFPLLSLIVFRLLVKSGNTRNFPVIVILAILSLTNLGFHLSNLGFIEVGVRPIIFLSLGIVSTLISLIGGRVIYAFTKNARQDLVIKKNEMLESIYYIAVGVFLISLLALGAGEITSFSGIVILILGMIRTKGWQTVKVFDTPMLWILHIGFIWLMISVLLVVVVPFVDVDLTINIVHTFSIGVIGSYTLGMMARSTLGHTGRAIKESNLTYIAFLLINLSVLVRVFPDLIWPEFNMTYIYFSAICWFLAFLLFAVEFIPMLTRKRIDQP